MNTLKFDTVNFSKDVKAKRAMEHGMDLRKLAGETDVSHSTLGRVENKGIPDLLTFAKLCKWLGKSMDSYIKKVK